MINRFTYVSAEDLLNLVDIKDVINYFDSSDLLDHIGEERVEEWLNEQKEWRNEHEKVTRDSK